jgi:hypothetical protein
MAKVKDYAANEKRASAPKKTSDGCSKNTRYTSKNDKANKKPYKGQGH